MLFTIGLIDPNHGGHRSRLFTVEAKSEKALVAALGLKKEKSGSDVAYFLHSKHGRFFANICAVAVPTPIDELKKNLDEEAHGLWAWAASD